MTSLVRYATTEMRKLANRMQFGVPEESSLGKAFFQLYNNLDWLNSYCVCFIPFTLV